MARIPTSREIMLAGGVDPDGPFEVGPFPAEMRMHSAQWELEAAALGERNLSQMDQLNDQDALIAELLEALQRLVAVVGAGEIGPRPTIAELEAILASDSGGGVEILPNGEVRSGLDEARKFALAAIARATGAA
jgi:hypothetical protein